MREDDDEPAKQILSRETEHNLKWFQLMTSDLAERDVRLKKAQSFALDKSREC